MHAMKLNYPPAAAPRQSLIPVRRRVHWPDEGPMRLARFAQNHFITKGNAACCQRRPGCMHALTHKIMRRRITFRGLTVGLRLHGVHSRLDDNLRASLPTVQRRRARRPRSRGGAHHTATSSSSRYRSPTRCLTSTKSHRPSTSSALSHPFQRIATLDFAGKTVLARVVGFS